MPYSVCPHCGKKSYSAAVVKVWTCPYCERTVEELETNNNKQQDKQKKQD